MSQFQLDDLDLEILTELGKNSKAPLKNISKKLGVPASTIHTRIKRLEKNKVIRTYVPKIDYKKIGVEILAFVMISFDKSQTNLDQEEVAQKIAKVPNVQEVNIIAGQFDILLKIRAKSIDDLGKLVVKRLKNINGVGHTITYIVLNNVIEKNFIAPK